MPARQGKPNPSFSSLWYLLILIGYSSSSAVWSSWALRSFEIFGCANLLLIWNQFLHPDGFLGTYLLVTLYKSPGTDGFSAKAHTFCCLGTSFRGRSACSTREANPPLSSSRSRFRLQGLVSASTSYMPLFVCKRFSEGEAPSQRRKPIHHSQGLRCRFVVAFGWLHGLRFHV